MESSFNRSSFLRKGGLRKRYSSSSLTPAVKKGHKRNVSLPVKVETGGQDTSVERFLANLSLKDYAQAFADQEICDLETLKELDQDDLMEIGVMSSLDRKAIINAAAKLNHVER